MRTLPHITAFAVRTRDGYIAHDPRQSTLEWRSKVDAKFFTDQLNGLGEKGAIVVGNTTYNLVIDRLSKRNCIVFTRSIRSVERRHEKLLLYNPKGTSLATVLNDYHTVALLGGSQTYAYFFERNLVDEIWLTTEPVEFGNGLKCFDSHEDLKWKFSLESIQSWNDQGTTLSHFKRRLTRAHE